MDITQTFYDNMAAHYDKLFLDWQASTKEQAEILDRLIGRGGFGREVRLLDCTCGIGTQAIGLAKIGYDVTASDISDAELAEAKVRAEQNGVELELHHADFCALSDVFEEKFDVVICMDNALPHMLTEEALDAAVKSISNRVAPGGMFIASIRDYDALLESKPPYSPPYIHKTEAGKRVSFQVWDWEGDIYRLTQYIIEDGASLDINKFECAYRAVRRKELTKLLRKHGFTAVEWVFPAETGFYQPIVVGRRG